MSDDLVQPDAHPTALARALVAISSHEDETRCGDRLADWLREATDATVTHDEAGNVIARRNEGASPTLALVGHHDVVPPDDSQVAAGSDDGADGQYVVTERDGRLYGRGTADMKGSLAAAACAFRDSQVPRTSGRRTQSGDADPDCELVFASFAGEEVGGEGCRAAIEAGFAPDYAVVGEGSTGYSAEGVTDVAVAHEGRRASTLVATGTAAHASTPEAGENAVYRATDAVDVVRELDAPGTEVLGERVTGSVVVTGIEGGEEWNTVPEQCEVTVDERTVPGERADLERATTAGEIDGVERRVDQDLPPMRCGDEGFARTAREAAAAAQSGDPELVVKPHATDAGWLDSRAGTACVVVGAAEPGEAHTADESVSLAVLDRCYGIYRGIAESVG
jgi:acetylornithine deacetylase